MDARKRESSADAGRRIEILRSGDQAILALLLAVGLLAFVLNWCLTGGPRGRLVNIDQTAGWTYEFHVDLNTASEPELALLPGIGETLARRIVDHRRQRGGFATPSQLLSVRGIGPKTLEKIRPFLADSPEPEVP